MRMQTSRHLVPVMWSATLLCMSVSRLLHLTFLLGLRLVQLLWLQLRLVQLRVVQICLVQVFRSRAALAASVSAPVLVVSPLVSDSGVGGVKDALSHAVEENLSGILEAGGAFPGDLQSSGKSCDSEVPGDAQTQKLSPLVAAHPSRALSQ